MSPVSVSEVFVNVKTARYFRRLDRVGRQSGQFPLARSSFIHIEGVPAAGIREVRRPDVRQIDRRGRGRAGPSEGVLAGYLSLGVKFALSESVSVSGSPAGAVPANPPPVQPAIAKVLPPSLSVRSAKAESAQGQVHRVRAIR